MVKMLAPKDVDQVSVEQQNFKKNKDGIVTVPDNFVPRLEAIGFRITGAITVSEEMGQAIKSTGTRPALDPDATT
jgi:hypothetical protein